LSKKNINAENEVELLQSLMQMYQGFFYLHSLCF